MWVDFCLRGCLISNNIYCSLLDYFADFLKQYIHLREKKSEKRGTDLLQLLMKRSEIKWPEAISQSFWLGQHKPITTENKTSKSFQSAYRMKKNFGKLTLTIRLVPAIVCYDSRLKFPQFASCASSKYYNVSQCRLPFRTKRDWLQAGTSGKCKNVTPYCIRRIWNQLFDS